MNKKIFNSGTQIAYIPNHAHGDINHDDVKFGFVTSHPINITQSVKSVFCRYWKKNCLGVLRTTANSELTPIDNLIQFNSVRQSIVDRLMIFLGYMHNPKKEKNQ